MSAGEPLPEGAHKLVIELVAASLERLDDAGLERDAPALDALLCEICAARPDLLPAVRERLELLLCTGLVGTEEGRRPSLRTLGRYRIVGELGRGGMGIVYLALDPELGRLVALKALATRLVASTLARTRFEREIKAIASLKHRGILPIYEVGEAAGVPYFTTEYVQGRTLAEVVRTLRAMDVPTDELNTTHLGTAAAAAAEVSDGRDAPRADGEDWTRAFGKTYVETICRIVHDVAQALQHAHEHGVVHRDVKPSNILLAADGRALLFDFGLARIDSEETLTLSGDFAGTPYYVAPEQIQAKGQAIDARSDVYSLGVTLYELLTLRRPFEAGDAQAIFRQVLSREVPAPRRYNRLIPRDLETICTTALEKSPARRYQSAGELAADLRRLLEFRPVHARPIGPAARGLRWARRNPGPSAALGLAALIALGLPAGLALSNRALGREAERARLAERSAAREAERAQAVNAFLVETLGAADPEKSGTPEMTVRALLEESSRQVALSFPGRADIEAAVRRSIGAAYLAIGRFDEARAHLTRAVELNRGDPHKAPAELAISLYELGRLHLRDAALEPAEACLDEALATFRAEHPGDHAATARALMALGGLYADSDRLERALATSAEALAMLRRLFGERDRETLRGRLNAGKVALMAEQNALAEEHFLEARATAEALFGPRDLTTASALAHLGASRRAQGDYAAAERLWEEALETRRAILGPEHLSTAQLEVNLARVARILSRPERAVELAERALATQEKVLGAEHPELVMGLQMLGMARSALGDVAGAYAALERAAAILRADREKPSYELATVLQDLGKVAHAAGDLERAAEAYREALAILRVTRAPDSLALAGACMVYGDLQRARGELANAEELTREAYRIHAAQLAPNAPNLLINSEQLGIVLVERGKFDEAIELLREPHAFFMRMHHGLSKAALRSGLWLGRALVGSGEVQEAEAHLAALVRYADETEPEGTPEAADVLAEYGTLLLDLERPAEALAPLERAALLGPKVAPEALEAHAETRLALALALCRTGRFADSEPLALGAFDAFTQARATPAPAIAALIELYRAWDRPAELARWSAQAAAPASARD
jgi:serine/threonine protein kinase